MKSLMNLSLLAICTLAFGLAACSDEVEVENNAKKKLKDSPYVQTMSVGTDVKPGKNTVLLTAHKGGDLERRFTFKTAEYGYLYIDTPLIIYSQCDFSKSTDIYTFVRKKNGEEIDSNILTTINRYQFVMPDQEYELKINLYNLGSCEYMNLSFNSSFSKQLQNSISERIEK